MKNTKDGPPGRSSDRDGFLGRILSHCAAVPPSEKKDAETRQVSNEAARGSRAPGEAGRKVLAPRDLRKTDGSVRVIMLIQREGRAGGLKRQTLLIFLTRATFSNTAGKWSEVCFATRI